MRGVQRSTVGLAILSLATACGPQKPTAPAVDRPAATPPSGPAPAQWFRGRLRQLPPWSDDLRRRIDPVVDGWPTEAWALRIESELPVRLRAALTADPRGLEALLADDFRGTSALWPAAFAAPFDDGDMTVRRGVDLAGDAHPRAGPAPVVGPLKAARPRRPHPPGHL